jgi:hypothetical protein
MRRRDQLTHGRQQREITAKSAYEDWEITSKVLRLRRGTIGAISGDSRFRHGRTRPESALGQAGRGHD